MCWCSTTSVSVRHKPMVSEMKVILTDKDIV
nr:MAG TPA: hypothetical protein [Caudoviricetes sp.]